MYGTKDAGILGYSHFTGGFPGGQAEYVRVSFTLNSFGRSLLTLFPSPLGPEGQR
jgi:threonine dehydrogenase-like Zn-dependent dehydrogenase